MASVFAAKGICFPKENGWGVLCVIRFSKVLQLGVAAGGVPIFAHPTDMSMEDARDRLQFLHCTFVAGVGVVEGDNKEEFAGVPVKICCL